MALSTKRQQLFVSSRLGVVQLGLERCQFYGRTCAECCLARDPYCSWDGQTCSGFSTTKKRRPRRQDVRYGDPCTQCPVTEDDSEPFEVKVLFGVEGNSTFLECIGRSPQAELRWTFQNPEDQQQDQHQGVSPAGGRRGLLLQGDEDHLLLTRRGLLLHQLQLSHSGVFTCTSHEHSFSQALARYRVHVIASDLLHPGHHHHHLQQNHVFLSQDDMSPLLQGLRRSWLPPQQLPVRGFKLNVGTSTQNVDEYCEHLWHRQKRRQQRFRPLKLKQEMRKARVRRNNPAEIPG